MNSSRRPTERRIDLPSGGWAAMLTDGPRPDSAALIAELRALPPAQLKARLLSGEVDDRLLLAFVSRWSFAAPITELAFRELRATDYDTLSNAVAPAVVLYLRLHELPPDVLELTPASVPANRGLT